MIELNSQQIAEILPQAYPFIMIDRVVEFKKGESLTAVKNITGTEWMFEGRTPRSGLFPETLLIEAAAQATLLLYHLSKLKKDDRRPRYILGKASASFQKEVHIGDQLKIKACATKMLEKLGYMNIDVSIAAEGIANIQIMYSVVK